MLGPGATPGRTGVEAVHSALEARVASDRHHGHRRLGACGALPAGRVSSHALWKRAPADRDSAYQLVTWGQPRVPGRRPRVRLTFERPSLLSTSRGVLAAARGTLLRFLACLGRLHPFPSGCRARRSLQLASSSRGSAECGPWDRPEQGQQRASRAPPRDT